MEVALRELGQLAGVFLVWEVDGNLNRLSVRNRGRGEVGGGEGGD